MYDLTEYILNYSGTTGSGFVCGFILKMKLKLVSNFRKIDLTLVIQDTAMTSHRISIPRHLDNDGTQNKMGNTSICTEVENIEDHSTTAHDPTRQCLLKPVDASATMSVAIILKFNEVDNPTNLLENTDK